MSIPSHARRCLVFLTLAFIVSSAVAQERPASPVRFTAAVSHSVRTRVDLPGSVESSSASLVAGEVAGLVVAKSVREGQFVEKGASLVRLRTDALDLQLELARAQLAESQARLVRAEHAYERSEGLRARDLVSDDEYDQTFAEFQAWTARVSQWSSEISRIELDLRRCHIRAPFAGMIVSERVEIGEWLAVGSPVMEIVSLDHLEVRVEIAEQYYPQVNVGDAASVAVEALRGEKIDGTIVAVIPRADARSRTFPVLVSIPNPGRRVAVGMLARVTLPLGSAGDLVLVPKDAIVRQGPATFVLIIGDDDVVQRSDVQTGEGYGTWIAVVSGVTDGQRVVTRGNERVFPGSAVAGEPLEYELP